MAVSISGSVWRFITKHRLVSANFTSTYYILHIHVTKADDFRGPLRLLKNPDFYGNGLGFIREMDGCGQGRHPSRTSNKKHRPRKDMAMSKRQSKPKKDMANDNRNPSAEAAEESDSDSDVGFSSVDFSGVDFDASGDEAHSTLTSDERVALQWERRIAFGDFSFLADEQNENLSNLHTLAECLSTGRYSDVLRSKAAEKFFGGIDGECDATIRNLIRKRIFADNDSVISFIELEVLGIAALNIFLQGNYTGPSFDDDQGEHTWLDGINPHPCFTGLHKLAAKVDDVSEQTKEKEEKKALTKSSRNTKYQNAVLAQLAVDGEWPAQICHLPYFLILARSILLTLADPSRHDSSFQYDYIPTWFSTKTSSLVASRLWCARAAVAHERLLQTREPSQSLWNEVESLFEKSIESFCWDNNNDMNYSRATVMLEWGLAQHHFDRPGKGKASFEKAQELSGLMVEVTGAVGKRTKFQQKATAQMLVRAKSTKQDSIVSKTSTEQTLQNEPVKSQLIEHSEEEILLEKIKFEEAEGLEVGHLNILDQSILLALCLDVKNNNPADGLTAEQMGAFLARVLHHHDDWMVYSTALLERSWLEFERTHARERAILQMQALVDQHTNRLTITQSTRKSVEESAPVQNRLKHLHMIVYPPRWSMIQDLADRYASLGIVTSAAELYTEIEFWGDVVDCYRRAGRVSQAEKIVRERLEVDETPRMWEALGDLTNDPKHYEKAIEVSHGRYSSAYIALGSHYFDKGELASAAENYEKALKIRPLVPAAWFRLGTISMQLGRWDTALRAFSEVVQQEPEESDAWANVAAIHMHNKRPSEAYPALVESLKFSRENWRVWVSKLYTCLDLKKYDEAIQACHVLMDLRAEKQASDGIPPLEAKCVRAIVGGALKAYKESKGDKASVDSARRTLSRVNGLLDRLSASPNAEPWVFETMAVFHEQTGDDEKVFENLMKEYRSFQVVQGWEKDDRLIQKMYQIVAHIVRLLRREKTRESLTKARFMVQGIVKKIETARPGDITLPEEVNRLAKLLEEIKAELQEPNSEVV